MSGMSYDHMMGNPMNMLDHPDRNLPDLPDTMYASAAYQDPGRFVRPSTEASKKKK